uniref:uncharacterized protein LOC122600203 n=1 Tax=Erigeron canadensis TaxID=72917 RepID=UPI001CB968D5|nr:uncharacterized protein LOC122600203 [Erigeron canadensis]
MSFLREYDHLKIQLKDILSATNNFDSAKVIGVGGFGRVYKGEVSLPEGPIMVAFKKLDRRMGQGNTEFWKEVMMLSKNRHENLISLMHYCIEGDEMILGYEYASRGSLDRYLSKPSLTWTQRLKICVGAARGLDYLHDPRGARERVIHRDIKSGNILLDENWMAKVSDFGLSKAGPANQAQTVLISNAVGTPGYCDPLYWEMGFLSKESDVYSFGVVLFELLCGRLCCEYNHKGELTNIFVPKWRRCYEENTLDGIIFPALKEQMDPGSLKAFSAIAYQCVKKAREERPTMAEVVKQLEFALQQQEVFEDLGKKVDFENLIKIADGAVTPLSYVSQSHLYTLFLKGILVDDGKTWIATNMYGEFSEVVSAIKCITTADKFHQTAKENSRFPYILKGHMCNDFIVEVKTLFMSPNVTYTVNLVSNPAYKDMGGFVPFKYKLEDETQYWPLSKGDMRDGWLIIELYQFTSYQNEHNFKIQFTPSDDNKDDVNAFYFEGIEFRPVEQIRRFENEEDNNKVDTLTTLPNSDIDWEQKLPTDYMELVKLSKDDHLQHTTKRELYFLFRKGFLIHNDGMVQNNTYSRNPRDMENDAMWFSINKSMKNRLMIPATSFLGEKGWEWRPLLESRFKLVATSIAHEYTGYFFSIACEINSQLLSYQTNYSSHFIYKWSENHPRHTGDLLLNASHCFGDSSRTFMFYALPHHTPFIGPKDEKSFQRSHDTRILKGHPKQRKDGWMEFKLCEVSNEVNGAIRLDFRFVFNRYMDNFDIVVEGIEFRPL